MMKIEKGLAQLDQTKEMELVKKEKVMLKEDLDTKELLKKIEDEMNQYRAVINSIPIIANIRLSGALGLENTASKEEIEKAPKALDEEKDKDKLKELAEITAQQANVLIEMEVSLRTLTWVRGLMIKEEDE